MKHQTYKKRLDGSMELIEDIKVPDAPDLNPARTELRQRFTELNTTLDTLQHIPNNAQVLQAIRQLSHIQQLFLRYIKPDL